MTIISPSVWAGEGWQWWGSSRWAGGSRWRSDPPCGRCACGRGRTTVFPDTCVHTRSLRPAGFEGLLFRWLTWSLFYVDGHRVTTDFITGPEEYRQRIKMSQNDLLLVSLRGHIFLRYHAISIFYRDIFSVFLQNRHFYLQMSSLLLWMLNFNSVETWSPSTVVLYQRLYILFLFYFNFGDYVPTDLQQFSRIKRFFTACHYPSTG